MSARIDANYSYKMWCRKQASDAVVHLITHERCQLFMFYDIFAFDFKMFLQNEKCEICFYDYRALTEGRPAVPRT